MELSNSTACEALLSALKPNQYVNIGRLIGNAVGLCTIFIIYRYDTKFKSVHFNARLLFKAHLWMTALHLFVYCIILTTDLIRFSIERNQPCDYFIPVILSFTVRMVGYAVRFGQIYSMLSIAGERLLASFTYRIYENQTNLKAVVLIILLQVFLSIATPMLLLYSNHDFWGYTLLFETKRRKNLIQGYEISISIVAIDILTLVVFYASYFVMKINSRRMAHSVGDLFNNQTGLSAQYQLRELSKCLRFYIPLMWIHSICILSNISIRLALKKLPKTRLLDFVRHSSALLYSVYPMCVAFIILFEFRYFISIFTVMQPKNVHLQEANVNKGADETNMYFMQLQKQLNGPS